MLPKSLKRNLFFFCNKKVYKNLILLEKYWSGRFVRIMQKKKMHSAATIEVKSSKQGRYVSENCFINETEYLL